MSQAAIGKYVSHRRDEFVLATKTGHTPEGYHLLTGRPWSDATIRRSFERSLRALKTEYVDILQLHSCNRLVLERGEAVEALVKLKEEGKTRFIGLSGDNDAAEWAVEMGPFDTLQTTYNLIDQRAGTSTIPKAAKRGMGVIVKRPIANMAWGRDEPPVAGPGDIDEAPAMVGYHQRYLAMIEDGPVREASDDPAYLAMAFVFSNPAVHTAIVGSKNPRHIQMNVETFERGLSLPQDVLDELRRRYEDVGYYWPTLG